MKKEKSLKVKWDEIIKILSNKFNDGENLDIEAIIYLIGLQELGRINLKFRKDQKIDLMHIAICRLLEPYGYYQFNYTDKDGWPHYKVLTKLPNFKSVEQTLLMKEAIINYFSQKQLIQ